MRTIFRSLVILAIAGLLFSGCGEQVKKSTISVASVAQSISDGVGTTSRDVNGDADVQVLVFEESHSSRAIQIESAIMLNRLYQQGTRVLALEGAVKADSPIDVEWFRGLPRLGQDDDTLERVAVQLLKEGEINNGEFLSLVYDDVELWGIEKASEYAVRLTNGASTSIVLYLLGLRSSP